MPYILPNIDGLLDSQGNTLLNKGRVAYTATYDDVALTTTQPLSPQLREIEETYFTTRIWYDTSGNATPFANPVESSDYEDAHVFFRKLNEDGTFESFVYATPLSGDDLTDMQLYCGIIEAYQVTEGAYQVAEGDYFVTP